MAPSRGRYYIHVHELFNVSYNTHMLDEKLQLKGGQTIALVGRPVDIALLAPVVALDVADAVLVFAVTAAELSQHLEVLLRMAASGKLTWIAYPKARQLETDMNRDTIRAWANANGLDPVRQIAIDEFWSALRFKKLA